MDHSPLGNREVTICDANAKMLQYGQKNAAEQGRTKGKGYCKLCGLYLY